VPASEPDRAEPAGHMPFRTVDEVAAAAGLTVRTVRFYASKGLLPPPTLHGRVGLYDEAHLARLRLINDLQEAGFTLSAIERFVRRMPADASAQDVEVFHALLTPWVATVPEELDRTQLDDAAGRAVDDDVLTGLVAVGVAQVTDDGRVRTRPDDLELGLQLLDLGVPHAMLAESRALVDAATGRLAEDLAALLRRHLLRPYLEGELPTEQRHALSGVIERLKPLTIQAVMNAMNDAVDRAVRERVAGRESDPV
jgi:DNA-binding transcriptional MerR regulator